MGTKRKKRVSSKRPSKRRRRTDLRKLPRQGVIKTSSRGANYVGSSTKTTKSKMASKALDMRGFFVNTGIALPFPERVLYKMEIRNSGFIASGAAYQNGGGGYTTPITDPWAAYPSGWPDPDNALAIPPTGMITEFVSTKYCSYRVINATTLFKYTPGGSTQPVKWCILPISEQRPSGLSNITQFEQQPFYKEKVFYSNVDNGWLVNSIKPWVLFGISEKQYNDDASNQFNGRFNASNVYQPPTQQGCTFSYCYQTMDRQITAVGGTWEFILIFEMEMYNLNFNNLSF